MGGEYIEEKKEENKFGNYPSVKEKIKMQAEKEKTSYTEFEKYISKYEVLPNGLTVEEQQIKDIENHSWEKKFSIRNNVFRRFDAWLDKKAQEAIEEAEKKDPFSQIGTLVETKTGKKVIEEIEEGEEVWCEEERTEEQKLKKVLKRIEKTNDILYHLYIGNQEIHTTEDHAIWLEGKGWKKAEDIHVGDIVRCRTGEPEKITNVWMEKLPEQVRVYNLSVEDCHSYYVLERSVLVHNECPGNNKVNIESAERGNNSVGEMVNIMKKYIWIKRLLFFGER